MRTFAVSTTVSVPKAELAAWHFREGALERLVPGWSGVRVIRSLERMENGAIAELSVPVALGVRSRLRAIHEEVLEGESFVDRMVAGPFPHWRHCHRFSEVAESAAPAASTGAPAEARSRLDDSIEYRLPFGPLGSLGAGLVRRDLERMFRWRHERLRRDLARHQELTHGANVKPLAVGVTGATGLVGSALCAFLTTGGHSVRRIGRVKRRAADIVWNVAHGTIERDALEGLDAVVHLAGESIATRWTPSKRRAIHDSRARGTALLARTLATLKRPPRVLISASAIGFYGDRGIEPITERSGRGAGFLADVCAAWEHAAEPARAAGIRVVHPRIGMVVAGGGGAVAAMLPPFRAGLGGPIGSGRQGVSWIALDDLIASILFAARSTELVGPYNAVAPTPVEQRAFARSLGSVLARPAFAPLPGFVVRTLFGDMGRELLLAGAFVQPSALVAHGFRFDWPNLEAALRHELGRAPAGEIQS